MTATYSLRAPRNRAERLIAIGRAALAAISLLAIWLDPSEPARYAETAYALLASYVFYSLLVCALAWTVDPRSPRLAITSHVVDLAAFTLLLYFTEGATSPFFGYFVFSLMCAALRWQRRGTLWTGLAVLTLYIGLGLFMDVVLRDPDFELHRFIIRSSYLAVLALFLGQLTTYEDRLRRDLARLAAWPENAPAEIQAILRQALGEAAQILNTRKALLVWDEPEEPYRYVAYLSGDGFHWHQEAPTAFEPLVAPALSNVNFLCFWNGTPTAASICTVADGCRRWQGNPVHTELQTRFGLKDLLSLTVRGAFFNGRLFFLDNRGMAGEELYLGELVARRIEMAMNRFFLQQRLHLTALADERLRLARDLHDGLLQTLTGIALQLELVRRAPEQSREFICTRLGEVQDWIAEEQRGLRALIQQMRSADSGADLHRQQGDLCELAARVERRWGIRVHLVVDPLSLHLSQTLAHDVRHLLHEALVNSAKHGGATIVQAQVSMDDCQVSIRVVDDGRGFPFRGHYDLAQLRAMQAGPRSLQERIAALRGQIKLISTGSGSTVEMRLPLDRRPVQSMPPGAVLAPVKPSVAHPELNNDH